MEFEDIFERMRRRIRELFEELESEFEHMKSMWSPDGNIEPLYTINKYPDRYEIILDLPYSDLSTLAIEIQDNNLVIECKLKEELEFTSWFSGRGVKFRKYYTKIKLPPDIRTTSTRIEKDDFKKIVRIILFRKR